MRRIASNDNRIHGSSPLLLDALHIIERVAATTCTVLVTGESGTGKELFARELHARSRRAEGPFVAINCASIPDSMMEAELFGHVRGSFTGATGTRVGRLAAADGGTLFLDEIGDMPLAAQAKLLRFLQEGTVTPVGADQDVSVDVRVVAATHRDLEKMVAEGTFRADLYFRLDVVPIRLPSLRERGAADILTLADHFFTTACTRHGRELIGFTPDALQALADHHWPGNVRELAQKVERAVLLCRGNSITAPELRLGPSVTRLRRESLEQASADDLDLKKALDRVEKRLISRALEKTGGNRTEAASLLGLNRTTLVEKMRKIAP